MLKDEKYPTETVDCLWPAKSNILPLWPLTSQACCSLSHREALLSERHLCIFFFSGASPNSVSSESCSCCQGAEKGTYLFPQMQCVCGQNHLVFLYTEYTIGLQMTQMICTEKDSSSLLSAETGSWLPINKSGGRNTPKTEPLNHSCLSPASVC